MDQTKLEKDDIIFSMIEKETNEFIGNIEIMEINNNIGELGIAITQTKQNKHFGQEAIKRLIKFAFNELNLNGLELNVYNFNHRGIKCYEKVGFVIDGQGKTEEDIHMSFKR
jgi:RimJ/RimL family protein N-acetyltransferase